MADNKPISRVAIIGTGVIGASWTALFLAKGLQVVATDIAPNAEAALRKFVGTAWPALKQLGSRPERRSPTSTSTPCSRKPWLGSTSSRKTGPSALISSRSSTDSSISCSHPTLRRRGGFWHHLFGMDSKGGGHCGRGTVICVPRIRCSVRFSSRFAFVELARYLGRPHSFVRLVAVAYSASELWLGRVLSWSLANPAASPYSR